MKYAYQLYTAAYYTRENEISSFFNRSLKYQDAFPALCFAFGMAKNYDEALGYVEMTRHDSLNFIGNGPVVAYDSDQVYPLWDTAAIKNIHIEEQLKIFSKEMKRKPKGVLDIGPGRMETSLVFSHFGIPVVALEPSLIAKHMLDSTATYWKLDPAKINHVSSIEELQKQDLAEIDTIFFCCSIEHLLTEDTCSLIDLVLPSLRKNKGLMVVANTINQYPLPVDGTDHVVCVNDEYFKALENKYNLKVIYHETNMFIAEF